jgi:hypothetical protein
MPSAHHGLGSCGISHISTQLNPKPGPQERQKVVPVARQAQITSSPICGQQSQMKGHEGPALLPCFPVTQNDLAFGNQATPTELLLSLRAHQGDLKQVLSGLGLAQEEAIGQDAQDKGSEESIFPIVRRHGKVDHRGQDPHVWREQKHNDSKTDQELGADIVRCQLIQIGERKAIQIRPCNLEFKSNLVCADHVPDQAGED